MVILRSQNRITDFLNDFSQFVIWKYYDFTKISLRISLCLHTAAIFIQMGDFCFHLAKISAFTVLFCVAK